MQREKDLRMLAHVAKTIFLVVFLGSHAFSQKVDFPVFQGAISNDDFTEGQRDFWPGAYFPLRFDCRNLDTIASGGTYGWKRATYFAVERVNMVVAWNQDTTVQSIVATVKGRNRAASFFDAVVAEIGIKANNREAIHSEQLQAGRIRTVELTRTFRMATLRARIEPASSRRGFAIRD